jgi:hypothetical protein
MSNFLDYLTWRGDLTLEQDPFNDIDALLLATLSYVDFSEVVPTFGGGRIKLKDAAEKFFELHPDADREVSKEFISYGPALLRGLAGSARFGGAYLLNYVDDSDVGREIQFAAVEIDTSDGVSFFSYRGTDDKIVGWKEDFNLSYMTVPAETEAVPICTRQWPASAASSVWADIPRAVIWPYMPHPWQMTSLPTG